MIAVPKLLACFIAVNLAACEYGAAPGRETLARAVPAHIRIECEAPTPHDIKILDTAAQAIELTEQSSWLDIGAQKLLGEGPIREKSGSIVSVCIPLEILSRVAEALNARGGFEGRPVEYQLALAAKLPNAGDATIAQVAAVAFNEDKQLSEVFPGQDIRPYARTVLAGFGARAAKFKSTAANQISISDSLGTGAAQVAVATGDPDALSRVVNMFEDALASVPQDRAIPLEMRDRLLELSWAIYYAGDAGRRNMRPIHALMQRKVESQAPPFGIVELFPKRPCLVLRMMDEDSPYSRCFDTKVPFEQ